jgi:predicted methyltransferase
MARITTAFETGRKITLLLTALLLTSATLAMQPGLEERIDTDRRSAEDRARDAGRKPAAVLAFLGVEAGDRVIDIMAAGGWYTEVLSFAVGSDGHVAAQNPAFILQFRDGANDKAMAARLADGRLPNVTRLDKEFAELDDTDGPFDVAISALNFHDIYNGRGPDAAVALLRSIRTVLKPGGVFGIIDHVGIEGADNAGLHRIEPARVVETALAAGFEVAGQSDVLQNAADDHSQSVFAEGLRGETDRFVIKLVKPAP